MSFSVARWVNKGKILARIRAIPKAIKTNLQTDLRKQAIELVAAQKRAAPVKTGRLRDNIKWKWGTADGKRGRTANEYTITVYVDDDASGAFYALSVEFGSAPHDNKGRFAGTKHPGTEPQPFFYPTYRARKRRIKATIKRGIRNAVNETKK